MLLSRIVRSCCSYHNDLESPTFSLADPFIISAFEYLWTGSDDMVLIILNWIMFISRSNFCQLTFPSPIQALSNLTSCG